MYAVKKEKLCSPEKYSILIPYKDFEKLIQMATRIEEIEAHCKRMEERNSAMHSMYVELLEKVAEINRLL